MGFTKGSIRSSFRKEQRKSRAPNRAKGRKEAKRKPPECKLIFDAKEGGWIPPKDWKPKGPTA